MLTKTLRRRIACLILFLLLSPMLAQATDQDDFLKAVQFDFVSGLSKLLERGVNPNCRESSSGETALILAVRENSNRAIDFLVQTNDVDLDAIANNGNNALMMAAYLGNKHAVETLIAHGAQVNKEGWSPLHYAATSGSDAIVDILVAHAASLDATSLHGLTPLMMAVQSNKTITVKFLLNAGANPMLKNEQGLSALDIAKKLEFWGMIEILDAGIKNFSSRS